MLTKAFILGWSEVLLHDFVEKLYQKLELLSWPIITLNYMYYSDLNELDFIYLKIMHK